VAGGGIHVDSLASKYRELSVMNCFSIADRLVNYLHHRLASSGEGIVSLGVCRGVCVCVHHINLYGEGNMLYPVLSGCSFFSFFTVKSWMNCKHYNPKKRTFIISY